MIIKSSQMNTEVKHQMRGGIGDIEIIHLAENENLIKSRLLSKIVIPIGASIGEHNHIDETEYYIIEDGKGVVVDNGIDIEVTKGDLVITRNGATHSIRNTGNTPLEMIAIIILEK